MIGWKLIEIPNIPIQHVKEIHNFDFSLEFPFAKAKYVKDVGELVEVGEVNKEKVRVFEGKKPLSCRQRE